MASITFPTGVDVGEVDVTEQHIAAQTLSPYTFSRQVYRHPGRRWMATFSYPLLGSSDANTILTFLQDMKGITNTTTVDLTDYTPHDSGANSVTMALMDNDYQYKKNLNGHYQISFTLVEAIST